MKSLTSIACLTLLLLAVVGCEASSKSSKGDKVQPDAAPTVSKDPSLVGHWKFDDIDGEKATDASGSGNDGKLVDGPQATADAAPLRGANTHSLKFDGKDDHVTAGSNESLEMTDTLTVAAWIKRGRGEIGGIIVNKEGEYEIGVSAGGLLQFSLSNGDPGWLWIETSFDVPVGKWTHVAATYSDKEERLRIYANGKQVLEQEANGSLGDRYEDWDELWIGGRQNGNPEFFSGLIDEVRIYKRALKPAEIEVLARAK